VKLTLLCLGATASMRRGGFPPIDEPLDAGAERLLQSRLGHRFDRIFTSPALAARQTATALGVEAVAVDALRDMDHGSWAGRYFADVHAEEPDSFERWLARPWKGTPDGETFAQLSIRTAKWIDGVQGGSGSALVVTHPMVIRALLGAAIGIAVEAAMRIDIAPLTAATLSHHRGWRLQGLGASLFG
jgi:broad specificity phosphatase PhoE